MIAAVATIIGITYLLIASVLMPWHRRRFERQQKARRDDETPHGRRH